MYDFFEEERKWEERSQKAARSVALDVPYKSPNVPHISRKTAQWLRFKGLIWTLRHDISGKLRRFFWERPFVHLARYFRSVFLGKPFKRDGDLFFYGINESKELYKLLQKEETVLLVGFSYCQKPKECPSKRFSEECIANEENEVCQQCFIGKMKHFLPQERTLCVCVPTINAIGEKVIEAKKLFPEKNSVFLISSCEMALSMFGDLGNMVGIQGLGIRLQGRVCNTMRAFALSEQGIKPGVTWVDKDSERIMLDLAWVWKKEVEGHIPVPLQS